MVWQMGKKKGIEAYRINNMALKRDLKVEKGQFRSGDCYIILNVKNLKKKAIDIHFWLVSERGVFPISTILKQFCNHRALIHPLLTRQLQL